ncbi:MAG: hypothetical protein SFU86_20255 [Pirellulaceae bacterium]|nr:hypothetical protein [Pirellulaceae bacterium]
MSRTPAILFTIALVLLAWLWMQGVHELGHVLAAWSSGGTVERVVWHPLAISRTDVGINPQPLFVVWAGPLIGALLPLGMWRVAGACRWRLAWMWRFFAGFCSLANGLYLGVGSFGAIGDAGDLLRLGAPRWSLWLFGIAAATAGLALWNGTGAKLGLGKSPEPVSWQAAAAAWAALAGTVLMLACLSPR